jgi:hypothetical protein
VNKKLDDLSIEDLYLRIGLYERVEITDIERALGYVGKYVQFDCYCCECGKESTFSSREESFYSPYKTNIHIARNVGSGTQTSIREFGIKAISENPIISRDFICARNERHKLHFFYKLANDTVMKIGQYPSIADLQKGDLKKYHKVLNEDYIEFLTAIKIQSNGVGIGSYVYLRRIIERLIEEAHIKKALESEWDENAYHRARVGEKINMLEGIIDEDAHAILKPIYGILSKGIHELDEEECLGHFNDLKLAIEFILDGKLAKLERELKRKAAITSINNIASK